jgi:antitoxin component YwqK of YwqJK toxin-antitoxin module
MMIKASKAKRKYNRQGYWKEYNKHAVLISEGTFLNNEKHGIWKEYYDTGELMIEEHYVKGIKHGLFRTFHRNGLLMSEGSFRNGLREGYFKLMDERGNEIRATLFIHDMEVRNAETKADGNEKNRYGS